MPELAPPVCLKRDMFGELWEVDDPVQRYLERRHTSAKPWARWLARRLAYREARALRLLAGVPGVPQVLECSRDRMKREWIGGEPMQKARPTDAGYYADALRLLCRLHAGGVAHNDLAKEPNWLVTENGAPALIDFQLATISRRRGPLFRLLAWEDLRHFLKHKRTYLPEALTARQRAILARPAPTSLLWRATGKRLYLFITRRLLGWADRGGPGDRRGLV